MNEAALDLGLRDRLSLRQCRHGGAAHDLVGKRRDRATVMARGRWQTESSFRRYTKIGKVQNMLAMLVPHALDH
eukprot:4881320-Pyramimonas_sp.AAC.1